MAPQSLLTNSTIPVLEQVVAFSEARHGVLAGNLANLHTPGYKTRDLSPEKFQESLAAAIARRREPASEGASAVLGEGLITANQTQTEADGLDAEALAGVRDSMRAVLHHDRTDVSLERQVTEIAKNQSQYNLAITILSQQFRQLRAAITENVG